MARKLFTFLGTSVYNPCYYKLNLDNKTIKDDNLCCYVQESLINLLSEAGEPVDEIVVFLTEGARKANWEANKNKECRLPGLEETLAKYSNQCRCTPVDIPLGSNEYELWQIFDAIFDCIEPGDKIIFDITHSFRSIPMLAIITLNYAKFIKECDIVGIYYGAIQAGRVSNEKTYCPIFNITPFVELLDWTVGIDKFISTGDVRQVALLIDKERQRFGKAGERDKAKFFYDLKKSIKAYINSIATCRGREISDNALDLKAKLAEIVDSPELLYIKPIKPLLAKMRSELETYTYNEFKNMLNVVKWCSEHNLIQQGITILQEGIITHLCERNKLDPKQECDRVIVSKSVSIKSRNLTFERWAPEAKERKELVTRLLGDKYFAKAAKLLNKMRETRNDINHASWRKNFKKSEAIERDLKNFLADAEELAFGICETMN